uniref:Reverse transcriptase domain-containing protein n=1 Tax=Meloidogyne enterolobii TaxID=390850 RepID=A0A6V7X0P2_MELEN|nr:unnamed protein product [Meloidogyne enterolobii]
MDKLFLDFITNYGFNQLIKDPTHISGSILDLIITNQNKLVDNIQINDGFSTSDHFRIEFEINITKEPTQNNNYRVFNKANINKIKPILAYNFYLMEIIPNISNSVSAKFDNFFKLVQSIIEENIPVSHNRSQLGLKYPVYIQKAIREKYKLFKQLKQNPTLRLEYNKMSNKIKYLIRNYLNKSMSRISNNKDLINKQIKTSIKSNQTIPVLISNNEYIIDDSKKCEAFATYFSELFKNIPNNHQKLTFTTACKNTLEDIDFDIITIANTLKALPNKNSSTQDDIPYKIFKNLHDIVAPSLCEIFRISLDTGEIPEKWKHSTIIPIFKNGNRSDLKNYRPISLTSTTCRIFEKIIYSEVLKFLIENDLLSKNQFGFLPKRSTVTQLILTLNKWYEGLLHKKNIDVIYIDLQKAFDKVPTQHLLNKLYAYGIRGKIHRWLSNFLTDRTFTVRINNEESSIFPTLSGVPQGSILAPLLFTIYINDLPSKLGENIFASLYADDIKITQIYNTQNTNIQENIDILYSWAIDSGLNISLNKSFIFNLGNKNPKIPYNILDHELQHVEVIKDLGIIIDNKLTFKKHIKNICKLGFLRSHQILRNIHTSDPKIWGNLFKTYILPTLEYGSPIWNPMSKELTKDLERVQKFFTKSALLKCRRKNLKYTDRLKLFQLETLQFRRYYTDVITMYKILFNHTSLIPEELFTLNTRPSRKHDFIIQVSNKNAKTINSFINRTVNIWNLIPRNIFIGHTLNNFKTNLKHSLPQILLKLKILP